MNQSSSSTGGWRRLIGVGCLLLLLVAAAGVVGWVALRVARPAASAAVTPTPAPLVTVTPLAPSPNGPAAFPSVPATVDGQPPPARAELD